MSNLSPPFSPEIKNLVSINRENGSKVTIAGIGTALPPFKISQEDILKFIVTNFPVKTQTKNIYKKVLRNESVGCRHFALDNLSAALIEDHDIINERFRKWAVELSTQSLNKALERANISSNHIDFLAVTTCTGYLCPGISSYLIESVPLRKNIQAVDLVGMGCAAAIPALTQALNFLNSNPESLAAVVCTEICSAAFFMGEAPDVVISNALFADGSSAIILKNEDVSRSYKNGRFLYPSIVEIGSIIEPEWRDTLRFRLEKGHLRNVLGKDVPGQAARLFKDILNELLHKHGLCQHDIRHWVVHSGGQKVLDTVESDIGLPASAIQSSRNVLQKCGNLSSATLFFVLEEEQKINPAQPGEWGVLASFGAGFSAYVALVRYY